MFFFIGFLLLFAGLALLVNGAFTLPNGMTVAARPARQLGGYLVSYLPILIVIRMLVRALDTDGVVHADLIFAIMTLLFLVGAIVLFVRGLPKREKPVSRDSQLRPPEAS